MQKQKKIFCNFCGSKLIEKIWEGCLRPFCEHCNEPIYENPVPATAVVVIDDKDDVLLVKRGVEPKRGLWCLPGGFMELGETPERGALRELEEETGLKGKINILLGVTSSESPRYNTVLMIGFLVTDYCADLIPGDDASDARFFHPYELPDIAFESHKNFIRIYCSAHAQ
jgi:8-oxo-dGTP diphosphatase